MIGIIGAMKIEVDELAKMIVNAKREIISGVEYISGYLFDREVVCAVCGIGKVNAAICTQTMILKYAPELIINTGVGGALDEDLHICDVVVGNYAVQHDVDTSAIGDPVGFVSTVNVTQFPLDNKASDELMAALNDTGIHAFRGAIASGDQFVSQKEIKEKIKALFGASVCEMEGAAIAHVCLLSKVPCAILRAISDNADEDANLSYPEFAKIAADQSVKALVSYFQKH